jgi:pilus assembly protein Flp/PilA
VRSRRKTEDGASAVEYALIVAFVAAAIVLVVLAFGIMTGDLFHGTCAEINATATTTASC